MILFLKYACNFTGKISASPRKFYLEVFYGSVHAGFNLITRAHAVVKQGYHFLFLEIGMVELFEVFVGFL